MKVLFFTNSLACGGAERVVATLANFWAGRGWEVTVVTLEAKSEDFYPLDGRVIRIAMHLSGESRQVLDAVLQNIRRIAVLRRILKRTRPDFAISMMSTPNVLLAFACRGIPVYALGSERCFPPHAPLGRIWSALRRKMYGRLSAIVALTRECADWVGTHSSARRVAVIPNPMSWPLQDNVPRIAPQSICVPGRRTLLAVGRLDPVKNIEALIGAFSQLASSHPDWDLVVLGEGPERRSLESLIHGKVLSKRVFVPGLAGNIREWYAYADLYVMTSHSEGFPNALAEALAHGLPAVSVDCNTGPRDIIRNGMDGLLVPPNDPAALVDALGRVMADADLRKQFSVRARDAKERFSIEKIAGMWEELFRELSHVQMMSKTVGKAPATRRSGP